MRKEKRAALKAEQEAARAALRDVRELSPSEHVAEYMKAWPRIGANTYIRDRGETRVGRSGDSITTAEPARVAAAAAGVIGGNSC